MIKKMTVNSFIKMLLVYIVLIFGVLFMVLPFFWMLSTSLKTRVEAMKVPIQWLPSVPQWQNYTDVFRRYNFLRYMGNTVFVALIEVVAQLFTCTMAAYAFARLDFPKKNLIFMVCIAVLMVPSHMMMIPRFIMVKSMGLMDSLWGIIVPNLPSIYATFFLRQHFLGLPKDLDESAKLDGAGYFRIYAQILLPLIRNGLVALTVIQLRWAWNDMLWPRVITQRQQNYVLSVAVSTMQGQYGNDLHLMMTAGVIVMVPMLLVFLIGQKSFIEGIALSGIKG